MIHCTGKFKRVKDVIAPPPDPNPVMGGRAPLFTKTVVSPKVLGVSRRDLNFFRMIHCTGKIKRVKDVIAPPPSLPPPVIGGRAPLFSKTIVFPKVLGVET